MPVKTLPMLRVLYGRAIFIRCQSMVLLIALMSLLVASLVSFLVFVFLEVPLLRVVQVARLVAPALFQALLVRFISRIIRVL